MKRETLLDVFADLAARDEEFLVYDDGYRSWSHSYAEVGAASRAFAARLARHGIVKHDKVIVWAENRPEWIVALWGCILAGAVVVPIDYRSSRDLVEKVRSITSAKLVVIGEEVDATHAISGADTWRLVEIDWNVVAQNLSSAPPVVTITKDDVAEILFTSGATAEPKGVLITHRNLLANIVPIEREVEKYRKYGRPFFPLRFLNLLPLSHMFGQAMATFIPPMLPGVTIFIRGYNPAEIVRQIKKRRVSVLVSVPKILEVLREHVSRTLPEAANPSADSMHVAKRWWRYRRTHRLFGFKFWSFVVGAAPLDAALEEYWSRLGFLVIQGYGLTETAPIVSLNHPFAARKGSVGKAIAGLEVRIAPDGEILVRGENVTSGYVGGTAADQAAFDPEGWFHTGDIGEIDAQGQLYIRGRKKEMIVTPEGLNVFPDDVEKVLNQSAGVRESAVVGRTSGGQERVHAVLVLDAANAGRADDIVREANRQLADHQRIRGVSVWPTEALPRTEGTKKLKRREIKSWVEQGGQPIAAAAAGSGISALLSRYAGDRQVSANTTLEELGLSSLERVELMVALEDSFQKSVDESAFSEARTIGELQQLLERPQTPETASKEQFEFPAWNQNRIVRAIRAMSLATWILPLGRVFAHVRVTGREHLESIRGPVIFASNHQSHMDTPVILIALGRRRYRVATAMAKEFFKAHFFPEQFSRREYVTNSLNYYLAAFFFNAFPIPQREAGARQTLQYIGELVSRGTSILIYPEGERSHTGVIKTFRPGIGMIAARLDVPVVPVRIDGLDRVLHPTWKMATPGPVSVTFGAPIHLRGDDYAQSAKQVEEAVRAIGGSG